MNIYCLSETAADSRHNKADATGEGHILWDITFHFTFVILKMTSNMTQYCIQHENWGTFSANFRYESNIHENYLLVVKINFPKYTFFKLEYLL